MVFTTGIAGLVPFAALLIPRFFEVGTPAIAWAFGAVFLLTGLSIEGSMTANTTYLLEIAPDNERPTYTGIANTVLGTATFLPVLGGGLLAVTDQNYTLLLLIGSLFSIIGWGATVRLREPRDVRADMQQAALLMKAKG